MNNLIPIFTDSNDRQTVNGRDLHMFLKVGTAYKDWFPRMCEYGFVEGEDFCSILSESTGGRPAINHQLTIDMAKQLCMIARNERGKQAREYFIAVENAWNSPELIMARALKVAGHELEAHKAKINEQQLLLEAQKPKVLFADAVSTSHSIILVGDLAKLLKQNGYPTGQKRLFEQLRQEGYLIKSGSSRNMPTQRAMDMELFEVKERTIANPDGSIRTTCTTKVTGKGQIYFINRFVGSVKE